MADKKGKLKGQKKDNPDSKNLEDNPLLKIDNRVDFMIESGNLLQDPGKLLFEGYENFDLKKEKDHFDNGRIGENSTIVVVLRYYEYVCIATFKFSFIIPILQSGLNAKDVFDMIKHALRNKLLLNAPTFDVIFEPDFVYIGKVMYQGNQSNVD
jgi:hypothetical protein